MYIIWILEQLSAINDIYVTLPTNLNVKYLLSVKRDSGETTKIANIVSQFEVKFEKLSDNKKRA